MGNTTAQIRYPAGRPVAILFGVLLGMTAIGCTRPIRATHPQAPVDIAELWSAPARARDLFAGVGGSALAPDPAARYTVIEIKRNGFSRGYTVTDARDREWSVKFPPEASTEVVASRRNRGVLDVGRIEKRIGCGGHDRARRQN